MLCLEVWSGRCVHTQGTHIGGKSVECRGRVVHTHKVHTEEGRVLRVEVWSGRCVHTQSTHIGGKSVVCGGVEWVCVHTHRREVLCAEGVLCAHTRYTLRREECCVWIECCVHTQGTHIGRKSVVCGLSVVCTHKVHT